VWLSALNRKLLREVAQLKGQVATIAVVLAGGITCFIALRGTWASLDWSREAYYDRCRFAHVFVQLERAPETVARRVEALPGVALVQTRITEEVSVPIEGLERAAYARLLSLPDAGQPATNALVVRSGRLPDPYRDDEVAVLASFADAHGLKPGHSLPAVIGGKLRKLRIAGLVLSPEFVYAIRPGALADDPKRYAALWMPRRALAAAFQLGGAFNDLTLRLQPGVPDATVLAAVDRMLAPYGGKGAIGRRHQTSHRILNGELSQLASLAGMVPAVFLAVAAFLINMVLARLIALQRQEIAVLKAVGYGNREVARHYLGLVAIVMVPGTILGVVGGWALGHRVLALYESIFRFPDLTFRLTTSLVLTAVLASTGAAVAGALFAVRCVVGLPPAEAMRPPAPARYRRGIFERLSFGATVTPAGLMVLREIERHPLRTALSSVGIAGAIALVVLGHFGVDSLDHYLEALFHREQRQDLAVAFAKPLAPRVVGELARMPGVITAEGIRTVPVRAWNAQRARESVLIGIDGSATLRRVVERSGRILPLPEDGVLMSAALGEVLGVQRGDRVVLELREGDRRQVRPVVAGFVDDTVGLQIYGRTRLVAALSGDQGAISTALLRVDPGRRAEVEARLRRAAGVVDVSDLAADVQRLRDMNAAAMDVWTFVSIALGACVILGVVYNNARIALASRSRELASLRVLGFSRAEISTILIAGLAVEVALAIPVGLLFGRAWAELFFTRAVDQETFRFQVFIEAKTYLLAALVALIAAAVSALWVRRSLDRLDLIGVLKTRE
jgi:putative ABC transport system permease protein